LRLSYCVPASEPAAAVAAASEHPTIVDQAGRTAQAGWKHVEVEPANAALSMITKEKHPMRVLFLRDHEISGLSPPLRPRR
jgi:hypothetical protein